MFRSPKSCALRGACKVTYASNTISKNIDLNSRCIVISQPMYFPWIGQFEQMRLSDTFIFYDDVQFSKGSFSNRVQIKTAAGTRWLTVPLKNLHLGQTIGEVKIDAGKNWQRSHIDCFRQAYADTPYLQDALDLMDAVFSDNADNLSELAVSSTMALANYFALDEATNFVKSSELGILGNSTQRVIDICKAQRAHIYLTGHGARNYLDCEAFEKQGIAVSYIEYSCVPYTQLYGAFTPYVSTLDLIANCGPQGRQWVLGNSVPWRIFMNQHPKQDKE